MVVSEREVKSEGPEKGLIAIVGEAPGEREAIEKKPFVGASGKILNFAMWNANIDRSSVYVGNVFSYRPPRNYLKHFFLASTKKKDSLPLSPLQYVGRLNPEYAWELERLKEELEAFDPNIIVPMGNAALWALTGESGISTFRGTLLESTLLPGKKVLPTFHPANVSRQYRNFPLMVADLRKAVRESTFPEINRIVRTIYVPDSVREIEQYFEEKLTYGFTTDVETNHLQTNQIVCAGFAPAPHECLTIPIIDHFRRVFLWPESQEIRIWKIMKHYLENTEPVKFQNGLYDVQMYRKHGIKVKGTFYDTMLQHHAMEPEMKKDLGTLASLYTNERSWKSMVDFTSDKKDA